MGKHVRVAVVGAGPAGLAFASEFGDADVFEEHPEVGLPRHCTSLVSASSAEAVGIPQSLVLAKYGYLTVTDLEGRSIYFRVKHGVYLIDRPGLEQWLASGVGRIFTNRKVVATRGGYVYTSDGSNHGPYDYVVLAEGAARRLSGRYGHVVRLPGLQVDVKSGVGLPGITVVYNQKLSKSYFAWIVEVDKGLYRVGLADHCCTVQKLFKLVKLVRGEPVGKPFGGGVLAGPPLRQLVWGREILVGDAGGLVKPLSGGGIILAVRSGRLAAEALARGEIAQYEEATRWVRLRLRLAFAAFRLLYGMRLVDKALQLLNGGEYVAVDYDDHVKTLVFAALTDLRSLAVLKEATRFLASNRNVLHFL
ncbi:Dehydrogenases (flavoproteins) [Pyrobaculum oguniense TE7]|uniref:Dehydrogenases (Flavoproteins) n=1 Tax=Pyrobaculum oguniense (strain DSM 13380 / JCM 10595 / TE7) TaxID=698757 RepID=H6QBW1_PYROT|nr:Dehydrogenases (flavoproteins) [Pyrobaculum oguniense TE7]